MDDCVLGGQKLEDVGPAGEVDVLRDVQFYINSDDNDVTPSDAELDSGSRFIEKTGDDDGDNSVLVDEVTFMEIVEEVGRDRETDVFRDLTISNEEVTLVLEWDETTVNIIAELDSAGGKAGHAKSKDWDEEVETSISLDNGEDKCNSRNEFVWGRRMETETALVLSIVPFLPSPFSRSFFRLFN
ncbi:hypothetical protein APHAL10511_004045 [Amanita phalloides]|nr:hypothetical protein APHAL10511_004045 [Amanita phalloides]